MARNKTPEILIPAAVRIGTVLLLTMAALSGCSTQPQPAEVTATPAATMTPAPPPILTVCASGCDFASIQAAIDDPGTIDGATIEITDPIHTEAGISVSKDVAIQGQGADQTIVQAHDTAEEAPDRVFVIVEGATVTISDMTIRHGNPHLVEEELNKRCGGGIMVNEGAVLTLENSVVSHNIANTGGGIWVKGVATVVNSTISHNIADRIAPSGWDCGSGGGIKVEGGGVLTLIDSTVSNNEAAFNGGGIFVGCDCTATLVNSTISDNQAVTYGGGLFTKGVLHLTHCTVVNNDARTEAAVGQMPGRAPQDHSNGGGGVYVRDTLHMTNTIVANNTIGDCAVAPRGEHGAGGSLESNSGNLVGDGGCDPNFSGDPMLGSLGNNGGDTHTYELLADSPAIDVVDCDLTTDQRGDPRPQGAGCDIGSFELQEE